MLVPLPLVVDADVLIRNVQYAVQRGYDPALVGRASSGYTMFTGVVIFATTRVGAETIRHLPEVAVRSGRSHDVVVRTWNEVFVPHIRFVDVDDRMIEDERVEGVRELHAADAATAALAVLLAPAVLLTDNRRHFRPLGLPDKKTDELAVDAYVIGDFLTGANAALLLPSLAGLALFEGSRKLLAAVGDEGALLIALLVLGGGVLYWQSEAGRRHRGAIIDLLRTVGPPIAAALDRGIAAAERIGAVAVEPPREQSALASVARYLAVSRPVMKTTEIGARLRAEGFSFSNSGNFNAQVRAWLVRNNCFHELRRGNWSLGYYSAPLEHFQNPATEDDGSHRSWR